jgi:hypothetical protein
MAEKSTIKIKRSSTSIAPALLNTGEMAYTFGSGTSSNQGGRLFVGGMGSNSDLQSAAGAPIVIGGKYFTDIIDAATDAGTNDTLVKRNGSNMAYLNITGNVIGNSTGLHTGNVTGNVTGNITGNSTGTHTGGVVGDIFAADGVTKILENGTDGTNAVFYGSVTGGITGNVTGNVTGNLTGNVIGNADTSSKWAAAINLTLSGDVSSPAISIDGSVNKTATLTLATLFDGTAGKVAGTFGSATAIPVVSVNAKGLVTSITTANVATSLSFRGDNATTVGTLNLLSDSLRIVGSGGVTTSIDDTTNTITVAMSGTGTLGALAVEGNVAAGTITVTGTLTADDATVADITVNGNATITGNLSVQGTVTAINSTTVSIGDLNIELAKDAQDSSQANGGGITINGPTIPATLTYSSSDDRWNFNKSLNVSQVYGDLIGNADTATKWATARNLSLTGDATASLTSVDGSANKSAVLTLATVNTNVGSFGDTLTVPRVTVNAKGLVTAVANQAIPNASTTAKGLAFFDSESFGVNAATGYVTLATVDGGTY